MNRHHNAPPLADRLELDHASLGQQAADALALEPLPPIMDEEDVAAYSERAKALKGVAAMIEKARKAEKDQILKDGRTIDAFFHKLALPVTAAADAVVGKINAWQRARVEAERRAEAERQRVEAEAAKAFGDEPEPAKPVAVRDAARVVTSTGRVAAIAKTVWRHRVVDPTKVPAAYLMVNDAALKAAVAGGIREIPGVEIYEDVQTAIR